MPEADISVVLPTYNRAAALEVNFHTLLALEGVGEIIVVDDGSRDHTIEAMARFEDPRINVIRLPENRGSPVARNTGAANAHGEWVLLADDDCRLPADYGLVLRRAAIEHGADIVSAPWLHPRRSEDPQELLAAARAHPTREIGLHATHDAFPPAPVRTPFLSGIALVRRAVFDTVRYDESYGGNAWREETSFFIAAMEAGFVTLLTPDTASFQAGQWDGGQRMPGLAYEAWVVRNNWRFLRRHAAWLRGHGYIRSVPSAQAAFLLQRWPIVIKGFIGAKWERVRGR